MEVTTGPPVTNSSFAQAMHNVAQMGAHPLAVLVDHSTTQNDPTAVVGSRGVLPALGEDKGRLFQTACRYRAHEDAAQNVEIRPVDLLAQAKIVERYLARKTQGSYG